MERTICLSLRFPDPMTRPSNAKSPSVRRVMPALSVWLLLTFMTMHPESGYAEWIAVDERYQVPGLQTVYVDPDTIQRDGSLVTLWQLTDFRWMQGGPRSTPRFLSTKTQKQFDCPQHRLRLLAFTEFYGHLGAGRPTAEHVDKDTWIPVRPESIDQALWELVCVKK